MSTGYLVSLAAVVVSVLSARLLFAALPLSRLARAITVTDGVLAVVGAAGLAFHCGAMFFRRIVAALPRTEAAVSDIRDLGIASIVWYLVPAVLVLFGLRRTHIVAVAVVALALAAVGVTMYNGGSLQVHLAAIFGSVVVLVTVAAALVLPPWQARPVAP